MSDREKPINLGSRKVVKQPVRHLPQQTKTEVASQNVTDDSQRFNNRISRYQ